MSVLKAPSPGGEPLVRSVLCSVITSAYSNVIGCNAVILQTFVIAEPVPLLLLYSHSPYYDACDGAQGSRVQRYAIPQTHSNQSHFSLNSTLSPHIAFSLSLSLSLSVSLNLSLFLLLFLPIFALSTSCLSSFITCNSVFIHAPHLLNICVCM